MIYTKPAQKTYPVNEELFKAVRKLEEENKRHRTEITRLENQCAENTGMQTAQGR